MRRPVQTSKRSRAAGFTLVELLVVIAIIGLIIALVLVAAADGVRRAEERATQSLITKLETGLADRLDALLNNQPTITQAHRFLSSINYRVPNGNYIPVGTNAGLGSEERRAQVMAQFDYLRSEMPDVFFLNSLNSRAPLSGALAANYPLNFAASAFPAGQTNLYNYVVPLGVGFDTTYSNMGGIYVATGGGSTNYANIYPDTVSNFPQAVSGMFGASFGAAAGVYKNLYLAAANDLADANAGAVVNYSVAVDGADNGGLGGYIDDINEVLVTPASLRPDFLTCVANRLTKHTHKTARSEMLYAILVEGTSPLGSVFNRDEFTAREVQDTDGDGLPEFVDAWGEPLQFYRWPIYYGVDATLTGNPQSQLDANNTDSRLGTDQQKGCNAYLNLTERREQNQLDPNQLLVSPGWWSLGSNPALPTSTSITTTYQSPADNSANPGSYQISQSAMAFMQYFQSIVDPYPGSQSGQSWDRSSRYARRAYFSKFLVLSAGPDKEPGVAQFNKDYVSLTNSLSSANIPNSYYPFPSGSLSVDATAVRLVLIENQAAQSDPTQRGGSFFEIPQQSPSISATASDTTLSVTEYLQNVFGLDDISNHNIQAPATGVR